MEGIFDESFDHENEKVNHYINDVHFEDTLTPDEEYYNPFSEPMYLNRNLPKLNSEQWEMVSSEIYEKRRGKGK